MSTNDDDDGSSAAVVATRAVPFRHRTTRMIQVCPFAKWDELNSFPWMPMGMAPGKESAVKLATGLTTAYVVRDAEGRVLLACWGEDAPAEARRWREQGYRVEIVDRAELGG